jgi:G:T-mismatch repair DNA endonuclease (very short patch repair protein)
MPFQEDPALSWRQRTGNVPKTRVRAWIDALKREVERQEQIERLLS